MKFDVNRLSTLAGLPASGKSRLSEGSNRAYHDKDGNDDAEYRFGKNQLSEKAHEDDVDEVFGPSSFAGNSTYGGMDEEELEETYTDEDVTIEGEHEDTDEEVVLEIDDEELKNEIRKMKAERLEEARLRTAIRNEIRDIFRSGNVTKSSSDSSWMYGNQQPKNSKEGYVTPPGTTLPGIGFGTKF